MRLCVIGASGQVGQEFKKLVAPKDLIELGQHDLDVCDQSAVRNVLAQHPCDAVVNLAAFHNVNGCEADPATGFAVNAIGARNVAMVANEFGRRVVFISSDYVFGRDEHRSKPYDEDDAPSPINVYGVSKSAGERLVALAHPDGHLIIRTSSLFGCATSKKGWTFPEMVLTKAQRGESLRIVNDQVMAPTYTYDLATRVLQLLRLDVRGVQHVVNAGAASWYDLACATLVAAGVDAVIEPVSSAAFPAPARRPAYSVLTSSSKENPPLRDWRQGLVAYLQEKNAIGAS